MSSASRNEILIVDDDPMDRMLIRRSLQELELGCTLTELVDGQAALDHLLRAGAHVERYALILLDLKMPKLSGLAVLKTLREHDVPAHIPVVVMSSSALDVDIESAYAYGARAYITKPIQHAAFREVVQSTGRFWAGYNQLPNHGPWEDADASDADAPRVNR